MSRDSQRHYTVDDYFTVEEMSEVKHEYWDGEIFAMAGASVAHNAIAANVLTEFRSDLRSTPCGVYGSDLRVQTPSGLYTYPDVSVICGAAQLVPDRSDTATNPVILVEVLSEATEEYDRGDKSRCTSQSPHCSTTCGYPRMSREWTILSGFNRTCGKPVRCKALTACSS